MSVTIDPALRQAREGDAQRLGQILLNLLGNAVKFTEDGSIRLRIEPLDRNQAPWRVRFAVEDSGIGLAPPQVARLFQPFEQADGSTTRRYGGTGLGLVICKRLVDLMGGEIGVDSRLGEGSTFWFSVPLAPQVRAPEPQHGQPAWPNDISTLAGRRILLAEDNLINQEVACEVLRNVRIEVALAQNGREAVSMAKAFTYDAILMDMQMPEMDGVEATLEIRRLPDYTEVPIIAMTANAFEDDRKRCLDAGMNDHVAKPADPDRLYATLMRWLT